MLLIQQHRFEAAERQIARAIDLQPAAPMLHYNRGVALQHLGRQKDALASFNSAIALKPDYDLALAQRNSILKSTPHINLDLNL